MVKEIQLDDDTYSVLEQIRLKLEAKEGRKFSFDEVIKYISGEQKGSSEEDTMSIIWERLGEIQDTLLTIKESLNKPSTHKEIETPLEENPEETIQEEQPHEEALEEPQENPEGPRRPRISIPSSPIKSRMQPTQSYSEGPRASGQQEDSFISFIKNVGAYPLSRIRKPLSQIKELENKQLVKIIGEEEDRVLVYKPYYDGIIASLPRTEQEVEQLSDAQKKILEEMHKATLVYKDQNGVWRLTTPIRRPRRLRSP
ncbi:MAG: hypothetical protein ACP5T2_03520 [Thermoprotei archaeon]